MKSNRKIYGSFPVHVHPVTIPFDRENRALVGLLLSLASVAFLFGLAWLAS